MKYLSKKEFTSYVVEAFLYYLNSLPYLRLGQALFNKLNELYPELADEVRTSGSDCFHSQKMEDIEKFLNYIQYEDENDFEGFVHPQERAFEAGQERVLKIMRDILYNNPNFNGDYFKHDYFCDIVENEVYKNPLIK